MNAIKVGLLAFAVLAVYIGWVVFWLDRMQEAKPNTLNAWLYILMCIGVPLAVGAGFIYKLAGGRW